MKPHRGFIREFCTIATGYKVASGSKRCKTPSGSRVLRYLDWLVNLSGFGQRKTPSIFGVCTIATGYKVASGSKRCKTPSIGMDGNPVGFPKKVYFGAGPLERKIWQQKRQR